MITIQYNIEEGRPNYDLNKTWASVSIADLVGFVDEDFKRKVKIVLIF